MFWCYAVCYYAECPILFTIMPSVIMLNVVMLSVVTLSKAGQKNDLSIPTITNFFLLANVI
jgi:hypothetical protein